VRWEMKPSFDYT